MWTSDSPERGAGPSIDTSALSKHQQLLIDKFTDSKKPKGKGKGKGKGSKSSGASASGGGAKHETVSVLDAKDRKQAELAISFVLKKYSEISLREALLQIDMGPVGGKDTAQRLILAEGCFEPSNVRKAQAVQLKPGQTLAPADSFMRNVVSEVSLVKQRLSFLVLDEVFDDRYAKASQLLDTFRSCCAEVSTSSRYKYLLKQVVLPLGNALRGHSSQGFRVADL